MGSGGVVTALLHSESGAGAGAYNSFDRWSTSLRGDAGSEGARLVTVHEALHAALNDTTAFGVLLAACVDLGRGVAQSVIAAALIAGLLTVLGATAIPAAVVTAVVPLFFDVRRVSLTPGEEYLLAELVARKESLDGTLTPRELYDQLTDEVRGQLSFMDFTDFLDTCHRAGLADTSATGTITLRPTEAARFRITLT